MEPGTFRHRLAEFAAEINAIVPLSALGFSRSISPHRTSFTYWYPLGIGAQIAEGSGAETAESLLRFFGAERVLTLPLPECAQPTSAWLGFGSSAPLSDAQAGAVNAAARRAAAVLDGDEPLDSKLDRLWRLDAAAEMVTALTDAPDVRDMFEQISEIARKVLPHDAVELPVVTDDRQHIIPFATTGFPDGTVPPIQPIPPTLLYLLTEPWDSHIVDDLQADPDGTDTPFARAGYRSCLRVPIRLNGEIAGLLAFFSRTVGLYTYTDALIARRIADHVAIVMSHQRLADENRRTAALQARAANLQILDGLLNALTGVLDVRDVFDRISAIGNTVMPHDGMTIVVAPESGTRLTIYAATGALGHLPVPFNINVPDHSLLERVWNFDLVDDVQTQPRYMDSPSRNAGMRGLLGVPIWIGGGLKGSVNFFSWVPRRFTRDDLPVARRIADHLALALSHHRLAEEARLNVEATRRADEATARSRQLESRVRQLTDELDARTGYRRVAGESVSQPPAGAVPAVPPARKREDSSRSSAP